MPGGLAVDRRGQNVQNWTLGYGVTSPSLRMRYTGLRPSPVVLTQSLAQFGPGVVREGTLRVKT